MVKSEGTRGILLGVAGILIGIVLPKLMRGRKELPFAFPFSRALLIAMGLMPLGVVFS